ncbi:Hypothetical protein PHPALM_19278 [Phytophthora palmivora]|uniref:RxLR effector n=1 Tax=Phytophthora palmivora TaxID=4796 RepID=A0A2P4XHQ7_9STRA|nr:Hypothetical protein PHPALM_19278 [Phytophthora palmivora]
MSKFSLAFLFAVVVLLSTVSAFDLRQLTDAPTTSNGGIPIAAIGGIAAAAAVTVIVLIVIKVRGSGNIRRPKDLELHEVVISPSQPAVQPLSTKKQFVYTAHI